jgi:mycothiol synthase
LALKIHFETVSHLKPGESLEQVQALLQHAIDHDGTSAIGEHIYLKLRAGQLPLKEGLAKPEETALAILAYTENLLPNREELPECAEDKRLLLGYLQFIVQPNQNPPRLMCEILVHPHFRRHGVGRKLINQALRIARENQIHRIDIWAYHHKPHTTSDTFSSAMGAKPERVLYNMRRPANLPLPEISMPEGVKVRSFVPGKDDGRWLALNSLVFAHHPENGSWTTEDLHLRFKQSWFNPQDFLVLEDESGKLIGWHWTKITPDRYNDLHISPEQVSVANLKLSPPSIVRPGSLGEIYIVGLHPAYHGKGLGKTLTLLGMHHLVKRGCSTLTLYVDETNRVAVKVYHALGFTIHHEDVSYRIEID